MEHAQAERVAYNLLGIERSSTELRLYQRSAKKGFYRVLHVGPFTNGVMDSAFQANYNTIRNELVRRIESMDIIPGEKSPHIRSVA